MSWAAAAAAKSAWASIFPKMWRMNKMRFASVTLDNSSGSVAGTLASMSNPAAPAPVVAAVVVPVPMAAGAVPGGFKSFAALLAPFAAAFAAAFALPRPVVITLMLLTLVWAVPGRLPLLVVLLPVLSVGGVNWAFLASSPSRERLASSKAVNQLSSFSPTRGSDTWQLVKMPWP